jgi:hypothetical protein
MGGDQVAVATLVQAAQHPLVHRFPRHAQQRTDPTPQGDRNESGNTETITVGELSSVRFLVESSDSNGSVSVFECYVPANSKMPAPHNHDAFEETIYGLEGVDDRRRVDRDRRGRGGLRAARCRRPCLSRALRSATGPRWASAEDHRHRPARPDDDRARRRRHRRAHGRGRRGPRPHHPHRPQPGQAPTPPGLNRSRRSGRPRDRRPRPQLGTA